MHTSHDLNVSVEFLTHGLAHLPLVSLLSPNCRGAESPCRGRKINGSSKVMGLPKQMVTKYQM